MTTIRQIREANEAKEEAIERVEENADPEWKEDALAAIEKLAKANVSITSDDVWGSGLRKPHEPRALGPMFRRAQSKGWIKPTPHTQLSVSAANHRRPIKVWLSLICEHRPTTSVEVPTTWHAWEDPRFKGNVAIVEPSDTTKLIARISSTMPPGDRMVVGKLFAAAPDLFEACSDVVARHGDCDCDDCGQLREVLALCEA